METGWYVVKEDIQEVDWRPTAECNFTREQSADPLEVKSLSWEASMLSVNLFSTLKWTFTPRYFQVTLLKLLFYDIPA